MTVSLRDDTCQLFVNAEEEERKTPKHVRISVQKHQSGSNVSTECLPCVSMSCTRTDLVYMTRSDSARDNLIVFLFLKGA